MSSNEAALRIRIVSADFYSVAPNPELDATYNHFRGSVIKLIPVIRIFGITPTAEQKTPTVVNPKSDYFQMGEKVCAHIHGVLPYIYIPFPETPKAGSIHYEVAESLDSALNSAFGSKKQHVSNVSTISGKPFYGYHSKEEDFLKIEFYHPSSIKRAVGLLQAGAICKQVLQPHEAHVPYILQFFIDYNLYGMSFINLSQFTHRLMDKECDTSGLPFPLVKVTKCAVEIDTIAQNILNPMSSSRVLNPGLANIREEEERRHEEDGAVIELGSPADTRDFESTSSDLRYKEQLESALLERKKVELSNELDNSQSLVSSQQTSRVAFDGEDLSVLKVLFNRLVGDDLPDEDSVLGFTPEENPDEADLDLSQPYISFREDIVEEEEEVFENEVDLSETLIWPELDGLSQIHEDRDSSPIPLYVDGNSDDVTPEKITRRTRSQKGSPRYIPLDFKLHKSPRRKKSGGNSKAPSSPELFKKLEEEMASLRSIKSPKPKVVNSSDSTLPSTSADLDEDVDIICDSDTENGETQKILKYDFLEQSSKSISLSRQKKGRKKSAKRVLFKMNPLEVHQAPEEKTASKDIPVLGHTPNNDMCELLARHETAQSISLANNGPAESTTVKEMSKVKVLPGGITNLASELPQNQEAIILNDKRDDANVQGNSGSQDNTSFSKDLKSNKEFNSDLLDSENNDIDNTFYSQSTIMSFYGDTTLCPSPLNYNTVLTPLIGPPDPLDICSNTSGFDIGNTEAKLPFYGDPRDTSSSKEVGHSVISLKSKFATDLEEFQGTCHVSNWPVLRPSKKRSVILEPAYDPPSSSSIMKKLEALSQTSSIMLSTSSQCDSQNSNPKTTRKLKIKKKRLVELDRKKRQSGEIEHATPDNSGMFKLDFQNLQDAQKQTLHKYTTLMVLELHANTRGSLRPDPEYDAVEAIFYTIAHDIPSSSDEDEPPSRISGIIMKTTDETHQFPFPCLIQKVNTEAELFSSLIALVDCHDPDIIAGYEIEMLSWGYLIERGYVLGLNLMLLLSRIKSDNTVNEMRSDKFSNKDYELKIPGRIILNVWRLMRYEVALMSYSFESVAYHVLHTRVPKFSFKSLTYWWNHMSKLFRNWRHANRNQHVRSLYDCPRTNFLLQFQRHLVLKYYLTMVDGIEKILDQLNLIGRTCELASLFGIQFYEVFSRGSQFRVESMMLRLAKRFGFIAVSPSVEQRAHMRAPESLPLIMEPESRFYADPVIVLDFQSLYPSMIIAYNYCFSTCLGRVSYLMESSDFKFGCTELKVSLKELLKLQKNIHVSPAGIAFVDKSIRLGILPQMLEEILQTRLMVKASMKRHKENKLLSRVLDARQLGLKLIANVTYGYTSANFSGRMPCIEVGDSVVSKGRETLERAIQLVENEPAWRAKVVYGDTDSLFVLCPGRNKEEAFVIGQQIADRVTAANPSPVKLKLEKVYQPCILQTKKRYVGFMYESPDQRKPVYQAKGIETVRRDGCPAASKILEKSLKLLFETSDMSVVKAYVVQQMVKVLSGRLNPAELTFAKEYRGLSGYQPNAPVPALKIAKEELSRDRRAEPRSGERVGYVVVCGAPGLPLISLTRSVSEYLSRPDYVLNADYYISKAILPPLARCFCLIGADVFLWYSNIPKKQLLNLRQVAPGKRKATIAQYFRTVQCLACGSLTPHTLCDACHGNPANTLALLSMTASKLERKQNIFLKICESCCARNYEVDCVSLDCPIYYRRIQATNDGVQTSLLYQTINELSLF